MSLADERRAIRNGVAASRASTFKSDLNALESSRRKSGGLLALERRGARVATKGRGSWNPANVPSTGGGGGIASPLTETSYAAREFWGDHYFLTSDGFFAHQLQPVKKLVMQDANGNPVVQQLAEPV